MCLRFLPPKGVVVKRILFGEDGWRDVCCVSVVLFVVGFKKSGHIFLILKYVYNIRVITCY